MVTIDINKSKLIIGILNMVSINRWTPPVPENSSATSLAGFWFDSLMQNT